jgi:hypothetical protein
LDCLRLIYIGFYCFNFDLINSVGLLISIDYVDEPFVSIHL